jgi:hypothetical protein
MPSILPRLLAVQNRDLLVVPETEPLDYFGVVGYVMLMVAPFSATREVASRRFG